MSLVDRITPWALTASPPIRTCSTPDIFNSGAASGDVEWRRLRVGCGEPVSELERCPNQRVGLLEVLAEAFRPVESQHFVPGGLVDSASASSTIGARKS